MGQFRLSRIPLRIPLKDFEGTMIFGPRIIYS
jgi:hypothetical protein